MSKEVSIRWIVIAENPRRCLAGFGIDGRPLWETNMRQAMRWENKFDAETDGMGRVLAHEWPEDMDVVDAKSVLH